jgi:hypothetical protein
VQILTIITEGSESTAAAQGAGQARWPRPGGALGWTPRPLRPVPLAPLPVVGPGPVVLGCCQCGAARARVAGGGICGSLRLRAAQRRGPPTIVAPWARCRRPGAGPRPGGTACQRRLRVRQSLRGPGPGLGSRSLAAEAPPVTAGQRVVCARWSGIELAGRAHLRPRAGAFGICWTSSLRLGVTQSRSRRGLTCQRCGGRSKPTQQTALSL